MTDEELKAIEARANAATPGPWLADDLKVRAPASTVVGDKYGPIGEDIEFIAHAREDIPKLIAEIRRLRAMDDGDRQYEEGLRLLCEPKTEK